MKSFTRRFLEELAYVLDAIGRYNPKPFANPLILFLGSLSLTVVASFATDIRALLIPLAYSLAFIAITRVRVSDIARVEIPIALLGLVSSIPLLVAGKPYIESLSAIRFGFSWCGLESFLLLFLRVSIAPLPLVTAMLYLGWTTLSRELKKIPMVWRVAEIVDKSLAIVPRVARYLSSLLLGREARTVEPSLRRVWLGNATALGEALIYSRYYAEKLCLAINARTLTTSRNVKGFRISVADAIYIASILCLLAIEYTVIS